MTDRDIIPVYDEQGRRLYTAQQLADVLGITRNTLLVRLARGQFPEPKWVDHRTAVWHAPNIKEPSVTFTRDDLHQQIADRADTFGIDETYVGRVVHAIVEQFGVIPVDEIAAADLEHILDRWRVRHSYNCTWSEDDPDSECHCEVPGVALEHSDALLRESQMWAAEAAAND